MSALELLATALLGGVLCGIYAIGWHRGKRYGEDSQRVADILDQWKGGWRKLPPRGNGGRFTKECGQ